MPINFVRIDDRLIHGQIVTTWVKDYDIEQILVINDAAALDKTQQAVLTMAAPSGVKVLVFGVEQFTGIIKTNPIKKRTMLILANSIDILALAESGLQFEKLNVGGMRMTEGRRAVSRAVSVTPGEEEAFRKLLAKKIVIEIQMVPKDPVILLESLLKP